MAGGGPPRLAERILELLLPPGRRDEIVGDLEEAFRARSPGALAVAWYWGQVLLLGAVMTVHRLRGRGRLRSPRGEGGPRGTVTETTRRRGMMRTMTGGVDEVVRELRVTVRGLLKRPAYTLLTLATLVLGVGSMATAYGLLHQVVLRPLPFEEAGRLLAIRSLYGSDLLGLTHAEYLEVAEHADAFQDIAALVQPNLDADWTWTVGSERRPLAAVRVTDGFFRTFRVAPELGVLSGDGRPGGRRVVVSRGFWREELGADPSVVGSVVRINAEPYVVTGVLPASFEFPLGPEPMDAWILFTPEPVDAYAGMPLAFRGIGRLAPGVDPARATAEVRRLVEDVRTTVGDMPGTTLVRSLEEDFVGSARRPLLLLTLAGMLVLVVASLNLSMLIAARNLERRDELGVRTALGATRGQLLRHLLSEAGVLAILGGGIGVGLASLVLERVFESRPGELGRMAGAEIGPEVVVVGLAAAVIPALLAAALPAFRIVAGIRSLGSRGSSTSRSRQRFAHLLTAVESGAVFALLVVAVLVLRSFQEVTAVDPGFDTTSTMALTVVLPPERYPPSDREASTTFLLALEERLEALPGVRAAGTVSNLPLSPESWSGSLEIEGRDDVGTDGNVVVDWEVVSPGYFEAIGIPVVQGRELDERDRTDAGAVVVVNEALARRWWPGGDALGARISGGGPPRTVVGVVGDVKQQGLHTVTRGFMYLPALQTGAPPQQEVVVRVDGDEPGAAVDQVRAALLDLEPDLAIGPARTLDVLVRASSDSFRLRAVLLGTFAAMALLLGMAGIYGVTAHGVRTRRRDLGIRMAMGADGGRIMTAVLGEALLPVAWGLAGGLAVVFAAAPALRGFLFGVGATDPGSLAGIAILLLASAATAVAPSAVRARRIDPAGMLRTN